MSHSCLQPLHRWSGSGARNIIGDNDEHRRGRGRVAHESKRYFLYFSGSYISHHLHHVDSKRAKKIEGLISLLYDRVDIRISTPDLARIFIDLGGDAGGGRGKVRVRFK